LRPLRVYAPCYVGAVIQGSNITINCDNGTINDIANGIIVSNSSNIKIMNCNIYGNGFRINSSRNITILNSTIIYNSNSSSYASYIYGSNNILFSNISISKEFAGLYAENDSYNISIAKLFNNVTTTVATTNVTTTTAAGHSPKFLSRGLQNALLYMLTAAIVVAYVYIFLKIQYKKGKKVAKAKNRKKA
ncbi:MAG: right-handed parallel beta-helix repeat-containing protein, partial [Candidatus Micrarchaeia archaeon]